MRTKKENKREKKKPNSLITVTVVSFLSPQFRLEMSDHFIIKWPLSFSSCGEAGEVGLG